MDLVNSHKSSVSRLYFRKLSPAHKCVCTVDLISLTLTQFDLNLIIPPTNAFRIY